MRIKVYIPTLLFLLVGLHLNSQSEIPNAGFEDWVMIEDRYEQALGWETNNDHYSVQVSKSAIAHDGDFAMYVSQRGHAFLKFPFSEHPTAMGAFVSYVAPKDTVSIEVSLYFEGEIVDKGFWSATSVAKEYIPIHIPISQNTKFTDSILITVSGTKHIRSLETGIFIDDLSFDSIPENEKETTFIIYSNPFDDYAFIEFSMDGNKTYDLELFDLMGKRVKYIKDLKKGKVRIDKGNLPAGCYVLTLSSDHKLIQQGKLIVL